MNDAWAPWPDPGYPPAGDQRGDVDPRLVDTRLRQLANDCLERLLAGRPVPACEHVRSGDAHGCAVHPDSGLRCIECTIDHGDDHDVDIRCSVCGFETMAIGDISVVIRLIGLPVLRPDRTWTRVSGSVPLFHVPACPWCIESGGGT